MGKCGGPDVQRRRDQALDAHQNVVGRPLPAKWRYHSRQGVAGVVIGLPRINSRVDLPRATPHGPAMPISGRRACAEVELKTAGSS